MPVATPDVTKPSQIPLPALDIVRRSTCTPFLTGVQFGFVLSSKPPSLIPVDVVSSVSCRNKRPSIFKKHLMENHGVNADGFDIEMYSGKERTQVINNHKQFQQSLSHDYDEYLPVAAQRRRRRSSASSTPYSRKRSKKDKGPDGYPPPQSNISYSPDGHLSK